LPGMPHEPTPTSPPSMQDTVGLPNEFVIRARSPRDDEQIVSLFNSHRPELPPLTVEEFRLFTENRPPGFTAEDWVVDFRSTIIGTGGVFQLTQSEPRVLAVVNQVHPVWEGRAIGDRLFEHLLQRAHHNAAVRLYASVSDTHPYALNFAERRGLTPDGHGVEFSRIDPRQCAFNSYVELQGRLASAGITFCTNENPHMLSKTLLENIYDLERLLQAGIPGHDHYELPPYEQWEATMVGHAKISSDVCWIAMHEGKPVGLHRLTLTDTNAAWATFGAVHPHYRGKGIASALHYHALEWSRERRLEYVYAKNDATNIAIIAVISKIGFSALAREIELVKEL